MEQSSSLLTKRAYRVIGAIGIICLSCSFVGVLLVNRRSGNSLGGSAHRERRSVASSSSPNVAKVAVDPCAFSDEAKRAGIPEFLRKIKRSYLDSYPFLTIYMTQMTAEQKRRSYQPYVPTPAKLKSITDSSQALADELRNIKVAKKRLKKRERRILAQAKYFLLYNYGSPWLDNYYAGAWMLGPGGQCSREGISYVKIQIATVFIFFRPRSASDIDQVIASFKQTGRGIAQYEKNVRRGVTAGMVRSLEECREGLWCLASTYPGIATTLSGNAILRWIYPGDRILNVTHFLLALRNDTVVAWKLRHNETVQASIERSLVEDVGKPLVQLFRYLRDVHYLYCVPDDLISGMSSRPLRYVYYNGTRTGRKTRPYLPDGEMTQGSDAYDSVMAYFTTLPHSAAEVHEMGWRMTRSLYADAVNLAKNITGIHDEDKAVKAFKAHIHRPEMFLNQEPFPANESDATAHTMCSTIKGAKQFCPVRFATILKWFKIAEDAIKYIKPKLIPLFHHSGPKKTTPSCPVALGIAFNPLQGVQSYSASMSWCPSPARYYVPFFVDRMGPQYTEWAVSAHEANPGHHLQLQGFRDNFRDLCESSLDLLDNQEYTAFSEGWAMFAENPITTQDTDVFTDHPLEMYGMIKAQLWRALRLIIDTGLHHKNMSRDQAKELFSKYLWDDSDVIDKEITRYQSWPGQAVTYMTGQLAFWDMRKHAQRTLGDKFDIKDFHYHVLSQGEVPMTYLKEHIEHYVECVQDPSGEGCQDIFDVNRKPTTTEGSRQWTKLEHELKEIWKMKQVLKSKSQIHHW